MLVFDHSHSCFIAVCLFAICLFLKSFFFFFYCVQIEFPVFQFLLLVLSVGTAETSLAPSSFPPIGCLSPKPTPGQQTTELQNKDTPFKNDAMKGVIFKGW